MKFKKIFLKILNSLTTGTILLALVLVLAYSGYCLWDNRQIITAAENVRVEIAQLKPEADETGKPDFSGLKDVNPDVIGWITLGNTTVDYPILQGSDNLSYITTDVYGNYAVAGSIFLDTRCASDFSDRYSLVYGHHMANGSMFGDLDKYKDEKFFYENLNNSFLTTPEGVYPLELAALVDTDAYDPVIFTPGEFDFSDLSAQIEKTAVFLNRSEDIQDPDPEEIRILGLSTCSVDYTDARTILFFIIQNKEAL